MRTIKFRCWDKVNKQMIAWEDFKETPYIKANFLGDISDEAQVFMQFTGLLDKNGDEIFEGDILNSLYRRDGCKGLYEVMWRDARFFAKHRGAHQQANVGITMNDLERCEIIGNVFESPELLNPNK